MILKQSASHPIPLGLSVVVLLIIGCSGEQTSRSAEGKQDGPPAACAIGVPIARRVYLAREDVPMLTAPKAGAPKTLNARATQALGIDEYRTLSAGYGLSGLCQLPGFVQVAIVEADGAPVSWETGWIEDRFVRSEPSEDEALGLIWNLSADPPLSANERKTVRATVTQILREEKKCAKIIDGARSTSGKGSFFVTCHPRDGSETFNIWFTPPGSASSARIASSTPYPESNARAACEAEIVRQVLNPQSLDLNRITGYATKGYNNGNRLVRQSFSANNSLGVSAKFDSNCLVEPNGHVELTITELR